MTGGIAPLTARPAWKALEAHYGKVRGLHLRKLFADDSINHLLELCTVRHVQ